MNWNTVCGKQYSEFYNYGLDANAQVIVRQAHHKWLIYSSNYTETTAEIFVDEQYIYGSKRIGVMKRGVKIFENGTPLP